MYLLQQRAFRNNCIHLYLLVVMKTTGCGRATAPSGWEEHQACPAKRWDEVERKRGGKHMRYWKRQVIYFLESFDAASAKAAASKNCVPFIRTQSYKLNE